MCRWPRGLTESDLPIGLPLMSGASRNADSCQLKELHSSRPTQPVPANQPASSEPENAWLICLESGLLRLCACFVFGARVDLG